MLLPNNSNKEEADDIWTKQNRLDLVLPAIRLAAEENRDPQENTVKLSSSKLFPTFSDILPGWSIHVEAADTICNSIYGGLEAVRLRCNTGSLPFTLLILFTVYH